VNYVCVCACDGAWNRDLAKMILPTNSKCHYINGRNLFPCVPFSCEEVGFWSQFPFLDSDICPPLSFFLKGGNAGVKV
jgi:hypothetical protein